MNTCLVFCTEISDGCIGNFLQQLVCAFRLRKAKGLSLVKCFGSLSLNHIAKNSPRCASKTNQRHAIVQAFKGMGNGFHHILQTIIDIWCFYLINVSLTANGVRQPWAKIGLHLHLDSHGLGNNQNITEQDGSISANFINWHHSDVGRQFRYLTACKKVILLFELHKIWQISAGLSHHPNGWSPKGFPL